MELLHIFLQLHYLYSMIPALLFQMLHIYLERYIILEWSRMLWELLVFLENIPGYGKTSNDVPRSKKHGFIMHRKCSNEKGFVVNTDEYVGTEIMIFSKYQRVGAVRKLFEYISILRYCFSLKLH